MTSPSFSRTLLACGLPVRSVQATTAGRNCYSTANTLTRSQALRLTPGGTRGAISRGTVFAQCFSRSSLSKCRCPAVSRASFLLGPVRRGSGSFVGRCLSQPLAPHRQWQWQQRAGSSVAAPATACLPLGSRRRLARLLLLLAAACRAGELVGRDGLAFSGTGRPMCARLAPISGTWPAPRHNK